MSLFTDIKHFLKKYFKNQVVMTAVAYIIYKILKTHLGKTLLTEKVEEVKKHGKWFILHDKNLNLFIVVNETGDEVYSHKNLKVVEDEIRRLK